MSTTTETTNLAEAITSSLAAGTLNTTPELRKKARESFSELGLPGPKNEEYKFTPVTRLLTKQFSAAETVTQTRSSFTQIDAFLTPELSNQRIVFLNGQFSKSLSSIDSEDFTVTSLAQAIESHSEVVLNHLGKYENQSDPFALLNSAAWQDGLFIHVPKNIKVEKPLVIHHLHDANDSKVAAHTRLLVVVETGSDLTIVEKTDTVGKNAVFNTITEEIVVKENATLTYCKIQNDPGQIIQVSNTTIHQSNSSRANTFTFTMDGELIRNNLNMIIDGEGCDSHFYGLYLLHNSTLADNHTVVDHRKPNSFSNELYKGLMDDKSKGVFNGKIYVRPNAQKTNAFQSNRNILLSDSATINTKPQLEIWADDVKCSHGCTTGQLDDEALFYLQSRGIPKDTAKGMLLYAFAGEVVDAITNESLKSYVDDLISARLHKNF